MQQHNYSLTECENMIPWEREVYTNLLADHIQQDNERLERQQSSSGGA